MSASGVGAAHPSGAPEFTLVFSGVRDARFLYFCVMFYRSLFVLFHLVIVLSVLRFTDSDYPFDIFKLFLQGQSWSWSYSTWIYNYLCNQCLSPLIFESRWWRGVLDTTLCDKFCQWLAACWWFSQGTPVSPTNNTGRHDITEIMLKATLNTITLTRVPYLIQD